MYLITENTPMVDGKMVVATSSTIIATQKAQFPKCDLSTVLPMDAETPWNVKTLRPAMLELADEMVWDALWKVHEEPPEVKVVTLRLELVAIGVKVNVMAGVSVKEIATSSGLRAACRRTALALQNQVAQQFSYKFSELD